MNPQTDTSITSYSNSGVQINLQTPNIVQEEKPRNSLIKKFLKGFLIFISIIVILTILVVFVLPKILSLTAKDIPPFDDRDVLPKITKVSDSDNAYFDLEDIDYDNIYEPEIVQEYITLDKWDKNDIAQILNRNQEVLIKWNSANNKASFQNPIYLDTKVPAAFKSNYIPINPLKYSKLARLNDLKGLYSIRESSESGGLNILFSTLDLGQKIQQPGNGIVTFLTGIAVSRIGLQGIQSAIGQSEISRVTAFSLSHRLEDYVLNSEGFKEGLKQDYFGNRYVIDSIFSGNIEDFYSLYSLEPINQAESDKLKSGIKNNYLFQPNKTKLLLANLTRSQIKGVDKPCKSMSLTTPHKKSLSKTDMVGMYFKENAIGEILSNVAVIDYSQIFHKKCEQEIELNTTKLLLALRLYQLNKKSLPSSLEELTPTYITSLPKDPYDDKPLKYSAAQKIIYSVGKDKKDDNGQGKPHNATSLDYIIPINF